MTEHDGQTQENDDQQTGGEEPPFNYRKLEQSRDKAVERESKWRKQALRGLVAEVGLNPDQGTGRLALEAFEKQADNLDPDEDLTAPFMEFAESYGIELDTGQGGEGDGGKGPKSPAEQLRERQQQQAGGLRDISQPPGAPGELRAQIAAAAAEGDQEKVDALNAQWVAQMLG